MKRIRYYSAVICSYFEAVRHSLLKAYRYLFYAHYLKQLSIYPFLLFDKELREPTKEDFEAFRKKNGLSEKSMGLLVHILAHGYFRDRDSFYGREYEKWYSKSETLKMLLSGSAAWEKLQILRQKYPNNQDIESVENALFFELIRKKIYLNIPLK